MFLLLFSQPFSVLSREVLGWLFINSILVDVFLVSLINKLYSLSLFLQVTDKHYCEVAFLVLINIWISKVCFITLTFFDHLVGYSNLTWFGLHFILTLSCGRLKIKWQLNYYLITFFIRCEQNCEVWRSHPSPNH